MEHERFVHREVEQRRTDTRDDERDHAKQRAVSVEDVRMQSCEGTVPAFDLAGEREHFGGCVPTREQRNDAVEDKAEGQKIDHEAHDRGSQKPKERRSEEFENDLVDLR